MTERQYGKDQPKPEIGFVEAMAQCRDGWLIARVAWTPLDQVVVWARTGLFVSVDGSQLSLEDFAVLLDRTGTARPWHPKAADVAADDWITLTRQELDRTSFERTILRRETASREAEMARTAGAAGAEEPPMEAVWRDLDEPR